MNYRIKVALAVFLYLVMIGYSTTEARFTELVKDIRPAVVTVVVYDSNHQVSGIGSGFFIDKYGHLITNYHVIDGKYAAEVRTADGNSYPVALVVADNKSVDLVKLLVDIPREKIKWIQVSKDLPSIAEQIMVVGSPMGLDQTVSEGIVSSIREIPSVGEFFQMSAPISPGSSGGPVINLKGEVIGVTTFQFVRGQNLNFAIAGNSVQKLKPSRLGLTISMWTFSKSSQQPRLAEELCRQGYSFSINGDDQKALELFKEAIEQDPGNVMAWNGLGSCQIGLDRPAAAIEAYKQAIKIDPNDATMHYILGNYYAKLGRPQEAIESYQQVIRINPDFESAYFKLGLIYAQLGQLKDGKNAFETVIRLNPDAAPAHFNIGIAYTKLGRYQDAIKAHQEVLRINPGFAPAHNNLGVVYGKIGETSTEINAYKEAIRVDPDFAPAHYNLGYALFQKGDKAAALDEYKILKGLDEDAANKLFNLIYF
jgi:tetratricopeptide (TPR) repeat protein